MAAPLADRLRPKTLDDMVGQRHLLAPGKVLRKIIESGEIPNLVFYGPSGVGKTTLATMIARQTNRKLFKLNGTTASTSDIRDVVSSLDTLETMHGILLYLDEIQYFNKKQQQTLLEFMENGQITLIASTTENPYFYVYNAILSRSTVFEFKPVEASEVERAVERAFEFLEEERKETIVREEGVAAYIATACGGDVRKAMNAAELCVLSGDRSDGTCNVTLGQAKEVSQRSSMRYDKDGEEHYDVLSAFQKSMRGSDSNASLHYLARLLEAGDLLSACRRLMVCACEDVGLAWPQILPIVKAAVDIALQIGLPEARIPWQTRWFWWPTLRNPTQLVWGLTKRCRTSVWVRSRSIPGSCKTSIVMVRIGSVRDSFTNILMNFPTLGKTTVFTKMSSKETIYYEYGDNKNEQAFRLYWQKIK